MPSQWKLAHVCAIYKKNDPQIVSNYRPISLLSTLSKTLERIIHKHTFNFIMENNIITSLQSGFVPNDSTTNQLVSIYNSFCQALDDGKEVRAVFCDISKAFDRVWHRGLLYKLEAYGIRGNLLRWFKDYLTDRKQKVVLCGATSQTATIHAGVPQGSILGPLLFILYINDIVENIGSSIRLFADDTSLFIIVDDPVQSAITLNTDLNTISKWAESWLVDFNPNKTTSLLVSRKVNKPYHPPLYMNNINISEVTSHKHLGVTFSNDGSWNDHTQSIKSKAWQRINIMRKLKFTLDRKSLETIYKTFVRPLLEYSDVVWDNIPLHDQYELEKIQIEACRIISGTTKLVSTENLYKETCFEPLKQRREKHKLVLFYKMKNNIAPTYLTSLVPDNVGDTTTYNLRNANDSRGIPCHTQLYANSFLPSSVQSWNQLTSVQRNCPTLNSFKNQLNSNVGKVPSYYYTGDRIYQIFHARLRTHCSSLKEHLFSKNIINSPLCECGHTENTYHYFFDCPLYNEQRIKLANNINTLTTLSLSTILFGNADLPDTINSAIFTHVHEYIKTTKRFIE